MFLFAQKKNLWEWFDTNNFIGAWTGSWHLIQKAGWKIRTSRKHWTRWAPVMTNSHQTLFKCKSSCRAAVSQIGEKTISQPESWMSLLNKHLTLIWLCAYEWVRVERKLSSLLFYECWLSPPPPPHRIPHCIPHLGLWFESVIYEFSNELKPYILQESVAECKRAISSMFGMAEMKRTRQIWNE